jgi:predicted nucleic acid-binding protein
LKSAFVLDASVAVSWCFPGDPDEDTLYSRQILALLATNDAIVPESWAFEIANSIYVSFNKRRRITEQQIEEYLRRLTDLPITVEALGLWPNVELESPARMEF